MRNKYVFSNLIGTFVFNEHFKPIKSIMFKNTEQYNNRGSYEKDFSKKFKNLKKPEGKELVKILELFKDNQYFNEFYNKNLVLTKRLIKDSVKEDILIIQAINNMGDIDKSINILTKRLRDWYSLYNPEFFNSVQKQDKFLELILKKNKDTLLKEMKIKESMGADLSKQDLEPILTLARNIQQLYVLKNKQETYLGTLMKRLCPNLTELAGPSIGAKLLEKAGSFKHLMEFPASTVQLLGAEKALFRHMKNKKNKSPKFGILHEHPLVSQSKRQLQGKVARALADKIAIAVKVDYFKGKFIGDKLKKQIENKFK